MVQKEQRIKSRKDRIYHEKRPQFSYNREKRNCILAHADQIRAQGENEEQNEEEISTIPSDLWFNDLLEQPLQNETSKDEIMRDQVGQNEFGNSDKDQIMQEDDPYYRLERNISRSPRERNTREKQREQSNPENETITRSTRPTRSIKPIHFREM